MVLTVKDKQRIEVVQRVEAGRLGVEEGALVLGCSVRTVFRLMAALREEGIEGLVHGNRGKPSPRRVPESKRKLIVALARGEFADVNDCHLRELLLRRKKLSIGRETRLSV